jgi:foldase protein PrsA
LQRLGLILFGVLLIVLVVGFAVAQGIGRESVPEGDVALVEDGPEGENTVNEAEMKLAMAQQALQLGLKKTPKETGGKYEEVKSAALGELLDFIWIQGEAEELGIKPPTAKKMAEELEKIKEQNFPTPAAYKEFLETSKLTQEDVDKRVELQVLSGLISEKVQGRAGVPTDSEVADFYEAAKLTQFTTKPSRDVRLITNKDKAEVEAAKAELEADDSAANWKKVAQKYSSDPTTKAKGGLQPGLTEELLAAAGPFKEAIFDAATNELVGPVKYQGNYTLIEVVKLNAEKVQTLKEAEAQIQSTLTQQKQEAFFETFVASYQSKWESRTICASGFEVQRCSNFKGNGRSPEADPACYEADPKKPATACPSPVTPIKPAVPGSVNILLPGGEALVQRPVPIGADKLASEELPTGIEPVPGGE